MIRRPPRSPLFPYTPLFRSSSATAAATNRSQLAASRTSSSSLISVSSRSTRRAPPATRTPAAASARAVARPIPDEAPVTIAVLPERAMLTTARCYLDGLGALCDVVDLERHVGQPVAVV